MTGLEERIDVSIAWLRRDLRLDDNVALYEASRRSQRVCVAFVIDPKLLQSDRMGSPLVCAFFDAVSALREHLRTFGSDLALLKGQPARELAALAKRIDAKAIFFNEDYEPDAMRRDAEVTKNLRDAGLLVSSSLDHVYFGADEVLTSDGNPYKVFTPYKRRWLEQCKVSPRLPAPSESAVRGKLLRAAAIGSNLPSPVPEAFGFQRSPQYPRVSEGRAADLLAHFANEDGPIAQYDQARNFPELRSTSYLSPQLRAGTIGIRTCVEATLALIREGGSQIVTGAETWLTQLVWRDFFQMILRRFPHVADSSFDPKAARIPWHDPDGQFIAWCEGRTGYPIVDAGMRQLNSTGWMHNRLRMIVASFLCKNLLIDWRHGERYFEQHLADADRAQNNGGWQWAASTGVDAVPYFRIFNPIVQSKKFDPQGHFIKRFVPELEQVPAHSVHEPWLMPARGYPAPIVERAASSAEAVRVFKAALAR